MTNSCVTGCLAAQRATQEPSWPLVIFTGTVSHKWDTVTTTFPVFSLKRLHREMVHLTVLYVFRLLCKPLILAWQRPYARHHRGSFAA